MRRRQDPAPFFDVQPMSNKLKRVKRGHNKELQSLFGVRLTFFCLFVAIDFNSCDVSDFSPDFRIEKPKRFKGHTL